MGTLQTLYSHQFIERLNKGEAVSCFSSIVSNNETDFCISKRYLPFALTFYNTSHQMIILFGTTT